MKSLRIVAWLMLLSSDGLAFRTGGDTDELRSTQRVRWEADPVFALQSDGAPGLKASQLADTIEQAFRTWNGVECGALELRLGESIAMPAEPEDGINTIQWLTDGWKGRGFNPKAAGVSDVQYERAVNGEWRIVEADIYLNAVDHEWSLEADEAEEGVRDVLSVLTHEAGHVLGLMHPCEPEPVNDELPRCEEDSPMAETAMFPDYSPAQSKLSADDRAGLCFLYPNEACAEAQCAEGQLCVDDECRELCEGEICAEGEICSPKGCHEACDDTDCAPICEQTSDCRANHRCLDGRCRRGSTPLGDPCEEEGECAEGSCIAGYCMEEASSCDAGPCGSGDEPRPFGTQCEEAKQCFGEVCLDEAGRQPVCSRECDESNDDCPDGWSCQSVDERSVCVPQPLAESGCSFTTGKNEDSRNAGWLVLGLLGAVGASGGRWKRT